MCLTCWCVAPVTCQLPQRGFGPPPSRSRAACALALQCDFSPLSIVGDSFHLPTSDCFVKWKEMRTAGTVLVLSQRDCRGAGLNQAASWDCARAGDKTLLLTCGTGDGPGSGTPAGVAATQPYCDLDSNENNLLLGEICSLFISLSFALSLKSSVSLNVAWSPL